MGLFDTKTCPRIKCRMKIFVKLERLRESSNRRLNILVSDTM